MASAHAYNQILLFGDSITQFSFNPEQKGYGASLANVYARKSDVLNRGFSGYNTDWSLPILRQLLPTKKAQTEESCSIQLMSIFFGANDAALPITGQHVPLDRYKTNLKTMIDLVKDPASDFYNPKMRLILITPPPVNEVQWVEHCKERGEELNRFNHLAQEYAECVVGLGKEVQVPVVNLWSIIMDKVKQGSDLSEFFVDGLHLNANGYQALYEAIMTVIASHYKEIHPDQLEVEIPYFRDLINMQEKETHLQFPLLKQTNSSTEK
ncbi:Isoamyl acetate-hydrolyzing esterase 1 [Choanephora cucurbitarum]|uniref:Isoamyl acetate-hydrolyzing esterase 1 n=1 Tax=Choanephora cucurbitarum TaxID=101091 RepID=A0A1C7N6L8_9FUNG|nr:Isoamyl acetate-hydrolyzing esterase 1 [Choanephora cucurbitarum]